MENHWGVWLHFSNSTPEKPEKVCIHDRIIVFGSRGGRSLGIAWHTSRLGACDIIVTRCRYAMLP